MANKKELVFQDIDMFQNKILNPSSIQNGDNSKISMSSDSISSEADTILLKNSDSNYISLDKDNSAVDIVTTNVGITGTTTINQKMVVNNVNCNITDMNVKIQNPNNKVSIVGANDLSIQSGNDDTSEITSSYAYATEESRSKQFLVDDKVCIKWDSNTGSLLFVQK